MTSTIEEHRYNDLHRNNQQNRQFTVEINEHGDSFRRSDISDHGERSVSTVPKPLKDFYRLFQNILETADAQDGTNYDLKLTEIYPTDPNTNTEFPLMTVKVVSGTPHAREIVPRFIREENDPDHPGDKIQIFARRSMNRVKFVIWARTNKHANTLVEWVEDKFFEYCWYLRWMGFDNVVFNGREADDTENVKNQLIHTRTLSFNVITSRITKKRLARIKKIKLELNVDKPDSNDLIDRL